MIICIEGADGCGKTSVAEAVAKALGCDVIPFPNDDEPMTGPMIREYLQKKWEVAGVNGWTAPPLLSALAFQCVQVANRMALMPMLRAAKRDGRNLVLARYWQSGWVYGQLDGLPAVWLHGVHATMVQPDLNVLLDAPAEACMERRAARDGALAPERYEGKLDFTRRVVELYRELWRGFAPLDSWRVVDASRPFADVIADVIEATR